MSGSTQSTLDAVKQSPATPEPNSALKHLLQELQMPVQQHRNRLGSNIKSAWEAVRAYGRRSFLTMLSIVIGIAAVVGVLTLTQGATAFEDNLVLSSLGANTIAFSAVPVKNRTVVVKQSNPPFTLRDLQSLQKISHVVASSPLISLNAQVVYGNQNTTTQIRGVGIDMLSIQNWQIARGIWLSTDQEAGGSASVVLGDTVMHRLFDASGDNPLGQRIRIGNQLFRVVGVLAPKGVNNSNASDNVIFMPYKTVQSRLANTTFFDHLYLEADTSSDVDEVVQSATTILEQNHHIAAGSPDDFQVTTAAYALQLTSQVTSQLTLLFGGIAIISLTVGSIGIINMMLVSVTERTREIGVRMSLGARRSDIRNQFLVEALLLCLSGGLVGLLLGLLVGWELAGVILSAIGGVHRTAPLILTPTILLLPFVVSGGIGFTLGLYPAVRASHLDPVIALRQTS
jgi:putative ABC transport system permease protein